MVEKIYPHGVKQCIDKPTHSRLGQNESLIDILYTNSPERLTNVLNIPRGSSHHNIIAATRLTKSPVNRIRYVKKRNFKYFNKTEFRREIRKLSWWDIYTSTDVNVAVESLTSKINSVLDKMAPIKIFQNRQNYAPWLSKESKDLIKERDILRAHAKSTGNEGDWLKFKKARNKVSKHLKQNKTTWQKITLENCNSDSGKIWGNVLGWLNWTKSSSSPTKLFHNGKLETSPKELTKIMNNYYIDKIKKIRNDLPPANADPLSKLKEMMKDKTSTFNLLPVHPDFIEQIIDSLRNSKSCGTDNIDTQTIKMIKHEIVPAVTHIVNLSIQTSTFPTAWKKSKVVPLFKKDSILEPQNYRPVGLVPILSKILERVVFVQIVEYMETNKLFHPSLHGYRAHHNTTTALLEMYDSWVEAVERGDLVGVCMVDLSAMFDCIDHDILLQKMEVLQFSLDSVEWCSSYLSDRSQCVTIDGTESESMAVEVGVVQGSILGPLLALIYTNDLPEVVHEEECEKNGLKQEEPHFNTVCEDCGAIVSFADDTTDTVTDPDPIQLNLKLSRKYNIISEYFTNNRLKVNDSKTHLIIMATEQKRRTLQENICINLPEDTIYPTESERLLGIQIH